MLNANNPGEHPATTATLSEGASSPSQSHPEFFRLPRSGERGDPYFGLGRSWYYEAEKAGFFKLVRLRQRGALRGVTLVPYDAVAAFVRSQEAAV